MLCHRLWPNLSAIYTLFSSSLFPRFSACQLLHPPSKKLDAPYFLITNLWLLAFIGLGFLFLLVATTILLTHRDRGSRLQNLKQALLRALFANRMPRDHLKLVFIFFSFFIFFNRHFFGATIKTNKIAIPTDEIVDSINKLIDTSKKLVVHAKELSWAKSAPEGSLLQRLSKKDILALDGLSSLDRMKATGIDRFVIFADQTRAAYLLSLLSRHANEIGSYAFSKNSDYYERLETFHMRRSLDPEQKRFINSR